MSALMFMIYILFTLGFFFLVLFSLVALDVRLGCLFEIFLISSCRIVLL